MHALVGVTLPSYDEKTDAVLLYSETNVTVLSADKIRTHVREAYKILRPEGRERGTVDVYFNPRPKNHKSAWLVHPSARQGLRGERKGRYRYRSRQPKDGELFSDVKYRDAAHSGARSRKHRWL